MKLKDFDFRVWCGEEFEYFNTETDYRGICIHIPLGGVFSFKEADSFEVELWSGLVDKNDEPIFEGDIVKWRDELRGVIVFEKACFFVEPIEARNEDKVLRDSMLLMLKNLDFTKNPSANIEVIGNIHENAELLNIEE